MPATSVSGLKRWFPFGCTLNESPGAPPVAITLPSRPTSCARVFDRALRFGHAGQRPHAREQRFGEGGHGAFPFAFPFPFGAADGALARDHHVGVLVDVGKTVPNADLIVSVRM